MEENLLPKGFFGKNPLREMSAAIFADFNAKVIDGNDKLKENIGDSLNLFLTKERQAQLEKEAREIEALTTGESIERYMRKKWDAMSSAALCQKAVSCIEDSAEPIIRRFKTTMQDEFIELTFRILCQADRRYSEELFTAYREIRCPYAQAMACLLFGEHEMKDVIPFLLKEYERFRTDYSGQSYDQFPLLALYILCGKA